MWHFVTFGFPSLAYDFSDFSPNCADCHLVSYNRTRISPRWRSWWWKKQQTEPHRKREEAGKTLALTASCTKHKNFFYLSCYKSFSVNGANNFQKQVRSSLYSKYYYLAYGNQQKINTYHLKEAVGLRLCIFANGRIIFFVISMTKSMVSNRRSHDLR